jgi:hypothetical protein
MGKQRSITIDGRRFQTVAEACRFYGISRGDYYYGKSKGLDVDEIFKGAKLKGRPKRKGVTSDYNFAAHFPKLMEEWFKEKNSEIDPSKVTPKSGKKAWWKCRKDGDHVWLSTFQDRATGRRCPYCAGKRITEKNSLCVIMPAYAAEYAGDLNHQPVESITIKNGVPLWWRCAHGHEWIARPADRVNDNSGCPYCSGRLASPEYNLLIKFPKLASQIDLEKHPNIDINTITPYSSMKLWWVCPENSNHKWETAVSMRTKQETNCPFCSNKSVSIDNCLTTTHPVIAQQWDYNRNHHLSPSEVVAGSNKEVWWRCSIAEDHTWKTTIQKRTIEQTGCPCCAGQQLSVTNRLDTRRPDIAAMLVEEKKPTEHRIPGILYKLKSKALVSMS